MEFERNDRRPTPHPLLLLHSLCLFPYLERESLLIGCVSSASPWGARQRRLRRQLASKKGGRHLLKASKDDGDGRRRLERVEKKIVIQTFFSGAMPPVLWHDER